MPTYRLKKGVGQHRGEGGDGEPVEAPSLDYFRGAKDKFELVSHEPQNPEPPRLKLKLTALGGERYNLENQVTGRMLSDVPMSYEAAMKLVQETGAEYTEAGPAPGAASDAGTTSPGDRRVTAESAGARKASGAKTATGSSRTAKGAEATGA